MKDLQDICEWGEPDKLILNDGTPIKSVSDLVDLLENNLCYPSIHQRLCSQDLETWLRLIGEHEFAKNAEDTRLLGLKCEEAIKHFHLLLTTNHIIVNKNGAELAEAINKVVQALVTGLQLLKDLRQELKETLLTTLQKVL